MSKVECGCSVHAQVDVLQLSGYMTEREVAHDSFVAQLEIVVVTDCRMESLRGPRELHTRRAREFTTPEKTSHTDHNYILHVYTVYPHN